MDDLNLIFAQYKADPSDSRLNSLVAAIRRQCWKQTQNDDAAQDATLCVLSKLDTFEPEHAESFSRWVMSVARHRRLRLHPRKPRKRTEEKKPPRFVTFDEEVHSSELQAEFRSLTDVPQSLREIAADLLVGLSVAEIAAKHGLKPESLRRKINRHVLS